MNSMTVGARTIELDKDGFLVDLSDWSTTSPVPSLPLKTSN